MQDGFWLGVGSDHTDRNAETIGIALSKQLCAKVVGQTLWRGLLSFRSSECHENWYFMRRYPHDFFRFSIKRWRTSPI
jgi:hypothetical protein